jgi:hypothetical protein
MLILVVLKIYFLDSDEKKEGIDEQILIFQTYFEIVSNHDKETTKTEPKGRLK